MLAVPFLSPVGTLYAARLHSPVPNSALFVAKVVFDSPAADTLRTEMRAFLLRAFGHVHGVRAEVPLVEMRAGHWLLDLYSRAAAPTICDADGYSCIAARLPPGSQVRVRGNYEAMQSPRLVPMMQAIQIVKLVPKATRLFEPYHTMPPP